MRTLGAENFGIMVMAQAIIQYAIIFIDYGFNFSATMLVARNKYNQDKINKIFTATTVSKIILFMVLVFVYFLYINIFGSDTYTKLILWGGLSIIGTILFPVWLFQGLEKMGGIAINTVVSKTISLGILFLIVKKTEDINLAILSQSIGLFISGLFSYYYINKSKLASFTIIDVRDIKDSLSKGFDLFVSNVSISFYTTLNIIIIGYLGGPTLAGYFAAADKLKTAAQGLLSPVQQALFPRVSAMVNEGYNIGQILKLYGKKFIIYGACISISIVCIGYPLSFLYFSREYSVSSYLLLIMSPLPFIVSVGIVFGQWWLITNNLTRTVRRIYIYLSLFHILSACILMHVIPLYGVAISVVLTEVFISILFVKISFNHKI